MIGITLLLSSSGPTIDEPKVYNKCTTNTNTAAFLAFVSYFVLLKEIEPNTLHLHASGGMDPPVIHQYCRVHNKINDHTVVAVLVVVLDLLVDRNR